MKTPKSQIMPQWNLSNFNQKLRSQILFKSLRVRNHCKLSSLKKHTEVKILEKKVREGHFFRPHFLVTSKIFFAGSILCTPIIIPAKCRSSIRCTFRDLLFQTYRAMLRQRECISFVAEYITKSARYSYVRKTMNKRVLTEIKVRRWAFVEYLSRACMLYPETYKTGDWQLHLISQFPEASEIWSNLKKKKNKTN